MAKLLGLASDGAAVNIAAGAIRGHKVDMLDARQEKQLVDNSRASFAMRGFAWLQHTSSVQDFKNDDEVRAKYCSELINEAKRLTGADKIVVASHVFRQVGDEVSKAGTRGGAVMIHGDFDDSLKEQFEEMVAKSKPNVLGVGGLTLSEKELRAGRLLVLNFRRPIRREPLCRAPLAVCDPSSISASDLRIYAHDPKPPSEIYDLPLPNMLTTLEHSPKHRWFFFPGMTRDECLVFKAYDSLGAQPENGVGVHCSFEDPSVGPDAIRESVEARVICFVSNGQTL